MSKAVSYYDWSLGFKNSEKTISSKSPNRSLNSIGIADDDFKDFLNKWKKENLA